MFVFDLNTLGVEELKFRTSDSASITPAQPVFIDEDNVTHMGILNSSKRLGMTYIYCRPTAIYQTSISSGKSSTLCCSLYQILINRVY
jgi:hypothetical protein